MIVKYNEEFQFERLQCTLEKAKRSSFYQKRLLDINLSSLDDIKKIAVTSKEDLRTAGPFGLVSTSRTELIQYNESFGTTGIPVSSWKTANDKKQPMKILSAHGMEFYPEDIVFVRNPYALSTPAHEIQFAAEESGACVVPVSTRNDITSYSRTINLMYKLQPTVMTLIPLEGFVLAETAKLMGLNPREDFPALRAFYCAGELLTEKRRRVLEEIWGVKVFVYYGLTETGTASSSCLYNKLHMYPENFIYEVVDPVTMEQVNEGEKGLLLITTIAREAMQLIRYNTGDIVRVINNHNCPCGSKHPILELFGRYEQRCIIGTKELLFSELQDIVYSFPAKSFWRALIKNDELQIEIESEEAGKINDNALLEKLHNKYDFPFSVKYVNEGEVFNRDNLLKQSEIGKPVYVYDTHDDAGKEKMNQFLLINK